MGVSTSTFFTHTFRVCEPQPIFDAIETIAKQRLLPLRGLHCGENLLQLRAIAALAVAASAKYGIVRVSMVHASRSERSVWITTAFTQSNGRFGKNRCVAEIPVLRTRANAAEAIAAPA
jgi:hypothetical protein